MAGTQEPHVTAHVSYRLDGLSGCIATARELADAFLSARGTRSQAGSDVLLLVSELVTNATRHAPGPCVLDLADDGNAWTVAVTDTSPDLPRPRPPDLVTGNGGFGWHLLQTLAADVRLTPTADGGKTITAVVPYRARML